MSLMEKVGWWDYAMLTGQFLILKSGNVRFWIVMKRWCNIIGLKDQMTMEVKEYYAHNRFQFEW